MILNLRKLFLRFAQGQNSVSVLQLPSEEEPRSFCALKTVSRSGKDKPDFQLETHEVDLESDHVDPIKWFGILVPQTLKTARERYEKSTELVVEIANVEQKLKRNYQILGKLRTVKADFENAEE